MNPDERYMSRCLELAIKGLGHVAPNPVVGALIVYKGSIIGEGYHSKFGEAHAEVNAVNDALKNHPATVFQESTIYVSLEPCSHIGKTRACTGLLIRHKFARVVIACVDPFERVRGNGIRALKEAGINVETGILEKQAEHVNRSFMTFHKKHRPYIILKYAQSADGFIAAKIPDERNRWISNEYSRMLVQQWRSEEQAVMVGTQTARSDNPALTLRDWPGRQPLRVVIDKNLKLPGELKLFDRSCPTLVINELKNEKTENLEYVQTAFDEHFALHVCRALADRNIQSVIIEGGQKLLQTFINENLWDEARIFTSSGKLMEGISSPDIQGRFISSRYVADDLLEILEPELIQQR